MYRETHALNRLVRVIRHLSLPAALAFASALLLAPLFAAEPAKTVLERDFTQAVRWSGLP